MPANTDPIVDFPLRYVTTDRVDVSCDLVAWNPWIIDSRKVTLFYGCIAVTDATGIHLDQNLVPLRFGPFSFDDFERTARRRHFDCLHR
nr:hypothetical protein [Natrinema ejinorense]